MKKMYRDVDFGKMIQGIENGSNSCNSGFISACESGNVYLAKLEIEKCPPNKMDWNGGLKAACKNGHVHIVELIIEICHFIADILKFHVKVIIFVQRNY